MSINRVEFFSVIILIMKSYLQLLRKRVMLGQHIRLLLGRMSSYRSGL